MPRSAYLHCNPSSHSLAHSNPHQFSFSSDFSHQASNFQRPQTPAATSYGGDSRREQSQDAAACNHRGDNNRRYRSRRRYFRHRIAQPSEAYGPSPSWTSDCGNRRRHCTTTTTRRRSKRSETELRRGGRGCRFRSGIHPQRKPWRWIALSLSLSLKSKPLGVFWVLEIRV